MVGTFGAGTYAVRVTSTWPPSGIIASVVDAPVRPMTSGAAVTSIGPAAVFDVDVGGDELFWFTARTAAPHAGLDVHVINPRGEDLGAAAVPARRSVPTELPGERPGPLPAGGRRAAFADGLPATVEEVAAELVAAGLLDEALAVVEAHPEVDAIAFGPPTSGDVEAVVGVERPRHLPSGRVGGWTSRRDHLVDGADRRAVAGSGRLRQRRHAGGDRRRDRRSAAGWSRRHRRRPMSSSPRPCSTSQSSGGPTRRPTDPESRPPRSWGATDRGRTGCS